MWNGSATTSLTQLATTISDESTLSVPKHRGRLSRGTKQQLVQGHQSGDLGRIWNAFALLGEAAKTREERRPARAMLTLGMRLPTLC